MKNPSSITTHKITEMSIDRMIRYPYGIDRMRYNKTVGTLRVKNIAGVITDFGFHVVYAEVENKDVDIWVYNADKTLVLVSEVTNWRPSSFMGEKKGKSVQDNFLRYDCSKLFICSFRDVTRNKEDYFDDDVDIIEFGFQTQPVSARALTSIFLLAPRLRRF